MLFEESTDVCLVVLPSPFCSELSRLDGPHCAAGFENLIDSLPGHAEAFRQLGPGHTLAIETDDLAIPLSGGLHRHRVTIFLEFPTRRTQHPRRVTSTRGKGDWPPLTA